MKVRRVAGSDPARLSSLVRHGYVDLKLLVRRPRARLRFILKSDALIEPLYRAHRTVSILSSRLISSPFLGFPYRFPFSFHSISSISLLLELTISSHYKYSYHQLTLSTYPISSPYQCSTDSPPKCRLSVLHPGKLFFLKWLS